MKTKKLKKNRARPAKLQRSGGFTILFAVMLSSIVLAIALGVANIALKEINFSTSAKDANDAFFAADTGAECALFNDKSENSVFVASPTNMTCAGTTFLPLVNVDGNMWSFNVVGLGSAGKSCAKVTVFKDDSTPTITTITSKGYNANSAASEGTLCDPSSKAVERELEVTY